MSNVATSRSVEPRMAFADSGPFTPTVTGPVRIPDDMLYEVVDGKVVEKEMGASEVEIAGILGQYLGVLRGRSVSVALSSSVSSASIKPRIYSEGRTSPLFRMQVGPFAAACPMSQSGTWCPTWQSRSLARPIPLTRFRRKSTITSRPVCAGSGSSILASRKCMFMRRRPRSKCCN